MSESADTSLTQVVVKADAGHVRFFGRVVEDSGSEAVFFDWTCSGFEFSFVGISARAEFLTCCDGDALPEPESRAQIGVLLDGSEDLYARYSLDKDRSLLAFAEGLPFGKHTIRVVKLSEVGYGRAAVTKIYVNGTRGPRPTKPPERRMEFIGDSITCGYGNEVSDGSPVFKTAEENGWQSYAARTARMFGAEAHCICVSGNGVCHDYGLSTRNLIPELYRYRDKLTQEHLGTDPDLWDFSQYIPELIVIKLGVNDNQYCACCDLPENARTESLRQQRKAEFENAYVLLIKQVREVNPNGVILCIFDSDTALSPQIESAVQRYSGDYHDGCVLVHEVPGKKPEEGIGANGHWSITTHTKVALDLAAWISKHMGWTGKAENTAQVRRYAALNGAYTIGEPGKQCSKLF